MRPNACGEQTGSGLFVGLVQDITERKRSEQALRTVQAQLLTWQV